MDTRPPLAAPDASGGRVLSLAVLVAALGYLVDIYDLILFSIVRTASLAGIGVTGERAFSAGVLLLDAQLVGMLVGGFLWGVLADRAGRLRALFASILVYSAANLANAFVHSVEAYAVWRFIAGVGLAGELGAGVTLVAELLPPARRGLGTMVVAMVGMFGAFLAVGVAKVATWRVAYVVGGVLGLALLGLRIRVSESHLFDRVRRTAARRGDVWLLLADRSRLARLIGLVFVGMPIWYIVAVLVTFSPELARAMGVAEPAAVPDVVFAFYAGVVPGDLASGLLSHKLRSRKGALGAFLVLEAVAIVVALSLFRWGAQAQLVTVALCGFSTGYWAVLVTAAAEQFGTNLRATAATTIPNLVRATAVPVTLAFGAVRAWLGIVASAWLVAALVMVVALASLRSQRETFGESLDFVDE